MKKRRIKKERNARNDHHEHKSRARRLDTKKSSLSMSNSTLGLDIESESDDNFLLEIDFDLHGLTKEKISSREEKKIMKGVKNLERDELKEDENPVSSNMKHHDGAIYRI